MLKKRFFLLCLVTSILSSGCTLNAVIKSDLTIDGNEKWVYPLSVALVQTDEIKNQSFSYSAYFFTDNLKLYPGIISVVHSGLLQVFEKVEIVDHKSYNRKDYDLIINIKATLIGKISDKEWKFQLTMVGKDPENIEEIIRINTKKSLRPTFSDSEIAEAKKREGDRSAIHGAIAMENKLKEIVMEWNQILRDKYSLQQYAKLKKKKQFIQTVQSSKAISTIDKQLEVKNKDQEQRLSYSVKNQTTSSLGKYQALIIANNEYKDPTGLWSSLKTPLFDAKALKKILEGKYGFTNTILIQNATRRKIGKALKNLIEKTASENSVLIFYAGHGHFDKEITQTGYWVPTDAEGDDETTFVANSIIRDRVAQLSRRSKHVLLISDSCFSGNFLSRGRGIDIEKIGNKPGYFNKKNRYKSCQVLTSGGNEYVDDEYKNTKHSPFAYFLLRKLEMNDEKYLSATELFAHMERTVANTVEQTPRHGILKTSEDEGGEFFFTQTNK